MKWRRGEQGCIPIFVTLILAARVDTPAVANDQHYRTSHMSRTLPTKGKNDKWFFLSINPNRKSNENASQLLRVLFARPFAAVVDRRYRGR
jgi:hypothetical protein